jgi:hypothetical protein
MFKAGDIVAYRTKDWHGYQYIFAEVTRDQTDGDVSLKTIPNDVGLLIPAHVLTKVETVWQDTMKPVIARMKEIKVRIGSNRNGFYAVDIATDRYLGADGSTHSLMGPTFGGTWFETKGKMIDHFLGIGIDLVEVRKT